MANDTSMREALRLTRLGDPAGATRVIQAMLSGQPVNASEVAPALVDGGLIDLTAQAVQVSPKQQEPFRSAAFQDAVFKGDDGDLAYKLFLPANLPANAPLLIMLHGCTQNPDDFARGTGMNAVASEQGFAVAWPGQAQAAHPQRCWNWFETRHQQRGSGEPARIAGLTRMLVAKHRLNSRRVFVAGLSAGGAAAAVMGTAYPDLYAAVGVHSGLACGAASDLVSGLRAMQSGRAGSRQAETAKAGDFVPTIVFHGDQDATVNKANGAEVFADALAAAGGALHVRTEAGAEAGVSYTRTIASDAGGRSRAELWAIRGGQHAWSGGNRTGSHTDPRGPDASREMARFFLDQAK